MMTREAVIAACIHCTTEEEADALVDALVVDTMAFDSKFKNLESTRKIVLQNIGYITGYMSEEDGQRVLKLFKTEHPIFKGRKLTVAELFKLGLEYGLADRLGLLVKSGEWIEAESPGLTQAFPDNPPLICGSEWPSKLSDAYEDKCGRCGGPLALSARDAPVLEGNPNIVKICSKCFIELLKTD